MMIRLLSRQKSIRGPGCLPGRRHTGRHQARSPGSLAARRPGHRRGPHPPTGQAQPRRRRARPHRPRGPAAVQRARHGGRVRGGPDPAPDAGGNESGEGQGPTSRQAAQAQRPPGGPWSRCTAPASTASPSSPISSGSVARRCTGPSSATSHADASRSPVGPHLGAPCPKRPPAGTRRRNSPRVARSAAGGSPQGVRRRRFVAFDVLTLAGARVVQRSLEDGITLLTDLGFTGPSWCTIATWTDIDIADLLAACAERGAEGAIAKRLGSTYYPGQRRSEWRKIKTV